MNQLNNQYRTRVTLKRANKLYGPLIIPQKEEPVLSKAKAVWLKALNYPTKKLANIAGLGAAVIVFYGIFTFQYVQYRLHKAEFAMVGKIKFLEQKKILSILGEPVRIGHIFPTERDSIKESEADVVIPIQGTKADGKLFYHTDQVDGSWVIRDMKFEFMDEAGGVVQIVRGPE